MTKSGRGPATPLTETNMPEKNSKILIDHWLHVDEWILKKVPKLGVAKICFCYFSNFSKISKILTFVSKKLSYNADLLLMQCYRYLVSMVLGQIEKHGYFLNFWTSSCPSLMGKNLTMYRSRSGTLRPWPLLSYQSSWALLLYINRYIR